jgi:tRNA 2-thiouridine synthesizing protein A
MAPVQWPKKGRELGFTCHAKCFTSPDMTFDADLDAMGLLCPLPVLKARKRLQALQSGQVLRMLADDPAAVIDVPHFCAEAGHALLASEDGPGGRYYFIQRG